jgi:hypothetical protein
LTGEARAQFVAQVQYFSHLAAGGGYVSSFPVHNPGAASATVRFEMRTSEGVLFHDSSVTIPPGGTQTVSLGSAGEPLRVGWARLTAATGEFTAAEFFQLKLGGQEMPRVGVLPSSPAGKLKFFGFVGGQTNTGVAVANPSETKNAGLSVRLLTGAGMPFLQASTTLAPRCHLARFLNESPWFPGLKNFEGMVEVESPEPVILTMLRSDNAQLAAAPVITPSAAGVSTGGITRDYLADGAVSTEKLANGSVTGDKIAPAAVSFGHLDAIVGGTLALLTGAVAAMWEPSDSKTRLLFPYVTNQGGWDTGIAIVNTGLDPSGTIGAAGTATVYYYGTMGSGGPLPAPQTTTAIPPGQHITFAVSQGGPPGATSSAATFQGYIVVVCNFPFGHGHYVIQDVGANRIAWGGEALVLPPTRDPARVESRGH